MLDTVTVYFEYGRAEYTLNMPWALCDNALADARKLMTFMCKSNDTEHEAAKKQVTFYSHLWTTGGKSTNEL